jgi:hypothetical protein
MPFETPNMRVFAFLETATIRRATSAREFDHAHVAKVWRQSLP